MQTGVIDCLYATLNIPGHLCFEGTTLLKLVFDSGKKCVGVTLNPSCHLLGLSHSVSWGLLSSVNPRGAVEEPLIDCCLGKCGKSEAGDDF